MGRKSTQTTISCNKGKAAPPIPYLIQQRWINDHCESQTNPKNRKDHQ